MSGFLEERRARVEAAWELDGGVAVIAAGALAPIPGTNRFYPFRAHTDFLYLADEGGPGDVLGFAPDSGWTLFGGERDPVWEGPDPRGARPVTELDAWIAGRPVVALGAGSDDTSPAKAAIDALRLIKDDEEIARMRRATAISAAGHAAALAALRPGVTEQEIHAAFEAACTLAGMRRVAYDSIVASGPNAAVLHFMPTTRVMQDGELVLIDAGAEHRGYASDVTRTSPVNGTLSPAQRDVYDLVLAVQNEAIAGCAPGVEFRDLHMNASLGIARGLVDLGLLKGDPQGLVEQDAHATFMPHGLGHLLGLNVHDVGGYAPGREPSDRFGLKFLRTDRPLEPGIVVTIEPGCYFLPLLIERADPKTTNIERALKMVGKVGGIRIEDNIHITPTGHENLTTAIPK